MGGGSNEGDSLLGFPRVRKRLQLTNKCVQWVEVKEITSVWKLVGHR